jgi:ABC-type amino acid transport substrate-binding protein
MFRLVAAVVLVGAVCGVARADGPQAEPRRALVVGVKPAPPFAVKQPDGSWGGISIELTRLLATDLGVQFSVQSFEYVPALIEAVESGQVDLGVGALTVTPERAQKVDFTRPFYATGLAIAVDTPRRHGALGAARQLMRPELGVVIAVVLLLGAGAMAARRRWPTRATGALLAVGALLGIVSVAAVTAAVTSRAITKAGARRADGPDDLAHVRVATVPGSTSAAYLDARQLPYRPVATAAEALRALADGEVDAVVYDAPILHQLATDERVRVIPGVFEPQQYAFALRHDSPLRADLDRHLADHLASDAWKTLLAQHLESSP